MRSLCARAVLAGVATLALLGVTSCGNGKPDNEQRRSVTFTETYGQFTVYVNDNNRATGMAIESKDDKLELRATIVRTGQLYAGQNTDSPEFVKDLSCSSKRSSCQFTTPQTWASLAVDYGAEMRFYQNPNRDTFTAGLLCGRGGCNTIVERTGFTAHLFMDTEGKLTGLRLLETSKNFHLKIRLGDGRDVDCIVPECRIWRKDGDGRDVIARDEDGMNTGFRFERPLDWTYMRASTEGGLDPQGLSRSDIIDGSNGMMTVPKGGA